MKLGLSLKNFAEAANYSNKAAAQKGVKPMLSNLMITANNGELKIVGTDDEIMIISKIPANIEENGFFTISAKLLIDIISSFPDKDDSRVNLAIYPENENILILSSEKSEYHLQIQGIGEYPPVPALGAEDFPSFEVKSELLGKALKEGAIACATEGSPVHKSICVDFETENCLKVASLDGKRLAATQFNDFEISEELRKKFLIPSRSVDEIQKIASLEENLQIGFYREQLVFSNSKVTVISKLVDGKFPDYNRIFPSECSRTVKINKKEISSALKAILPIARLGTTEVVVVNIDIGQNEIKVWADTPQYGSSEIFVNCSLEGDPISTSFNAKFFQEFLNVLEDEEIIMELTTPNYPGVLKPGNPESMFKYVMMPIIFVR